MLLSSKTVEYIIPLSETDPDAEAWEYLLAWVGVDGGVYFWLFEDFEKRIEITGEVINTKNSNISKLFQKAQQTTILIAEDLSENEVDTISDILRAKIIRRYYKDGTFDSLAIASDNFSKRKSDFKYTFAFEVEEVELSVMR